LIEAYPAQARTTGGLTEDAFEAVLDNDGREPRVVFAELLEALENHKRGHQWRVKGMIPKLEKWLREGLYAQRHEEAPAASRINDKTIRTLTGAQAFIERTNRDDAE
jgi:hypothetical protein